MNKNNIKIMKTKHFLMALALPAVFAACTADDFVTGQPENPNLANRTVVGNISFVSPDVANTRLIWDNGLKWTETDKLGAALMDERKGGTPDAAPAKNYTIVDKLYSNYRYDYVNGSFVNGNAQFVEGNYFVYAQYNAEQTRTGLAYSIPTNQEDGTDGRDSWYKNQMWLDHIFVEHGDKNVAVNPIAVFPVVAFKAMYEGTNSGVEIRKVVVTDGTDRFAVTGTVQPSSKSITYDALKKLKTPSFVEGSGAGDYQKTGAAATLADVFNLYKKAIEDYGIKYTTESPITDIVNPNIADFFVADAEKSPTLTLNYTDPKASVNSVMVVPQSTARTAANLKFEIYTNKGIVTISGTEGTMSKLFTLNDKKDYTTDAGDDLNQKAFNAIRYNDGFKNAFLTAVTAGQMEKVEIGFKDDAILVPATLTVSDTEELKYYLTNWYAGKKGAIVGGDNNTVTINAVPATGKTVDIDNEVLTFMANAANPSLKFEGIVTIPAETSADALDKIVKGASNLNIVNNAVLAWTDKTHEFTAITNNATLTIGQNDDKPAEDFVGNLTNLGTLTLYADVTEITNGSSANTIATLNLNKGTVATLTNHAVVKVNGTVTVTGLTNNNELTVVKGTLTTGIGSVNNHAITVSEGAEWTVSDGFNNTGSTDDAEAATIENNGTITVTGGAFNNEATTATNIAKKVNAKITNNGQIACSGSGSFTNSGDMDANANSITLITTNAADAEVVVADGSAYINVPTNKGKITFIVTEQAALKAIPSSANSLRITATIDLKDLDNTGSGIKYLEFRSDKAMTITCNTEPKKSAFDHVIFNGGSAASPVSFVVKNNLTANKTLEVKKNARVTIENTMTFAATDGGDFTNNGSLLIIGTLDFSGIEEKDKDSVNLGTYLFAGGSADTNITWKTNA